MVSKWVLGPLCNWNIHLMGYIVTGIWKKGWTNWSELIFRKRVMEIWWPLWVGYFIGDLPLIASPFDRIWYNLCLLVGDRMRILRVAPTIGQMRATFGGNGSFCLSAVSPETCWDVPSISVAVVIPIWVLIWVTGTSKSSWFRSFYPLKGCYMEANAPLLDNLWSLHLGPKKQPADVESPWAIRRLSCSSFLGDLTFFRGVVVQIHVAMGQEYWILDAWFLWLWGSSKPILRLFFWRHFLEFWSVLRFFLGGFLCSKVWFHWIRVGDDWDVAGSSPTMWKRLISSTPVFWKVRVPGEVMSRYRVLKLK
jgi:hypothetical protein